MSKTCRLQSINIAQYHDKDEKDSYIKSVVSVGLESCYCHASSVSRELTHATNRCCRK